MRKYTCLAAILALCISHSAFAKPPANEAAPSAPSSAEAADLLKILEQSAVAGSLGRDEASRAEIMRIQTKSPELQRYIDWVTRYDQDLHGNPETPMPGAIQSFLVSFPYESSSMFDFGHALPPESGFDTEKPSTGALYPALNWKRYDSIGNTGVILPQETIYNPGYVTYFLTTRIVMPGDKPVSANLEIPSTTPVIAWLNQH